MNREGWANRLVAGMAVGALALAGTCLWWLASSAQAEDPLAERRARVESLSAAAKEDLLEHYRRFTMLDPVEQERVCRLHVELDQDPNSAELRRIMLNYYDWLKTLPPYQQAELRELPPARRVQHVKRLLEQQQQQSHKKLKGPALADALRDYRLGKGPLQPGGKRAAWLSPQDVEGILQWFDRYVGRHGAQILEALPEAQRKQFGREAAQTKDPLRRHEILMSMWLRIQLENPAKVPPPSPDDLADLRSRLSPDTRRRLEERSPAEQWRTISSVVPLFVLQQYAARRIDGALPAVTEEELAQFFEKELKPWQRDQLLSLPSEDMTRELWRAYIRWKLSQLPRSQARAAEGGAKAKRLEGTRGAPKTAPSPSKPAAKSPAP
jgi:hypothetical protein